MRVRTIRPFSCLSQLTKPYLHRPAAIKHYRQDPSSRRRLEYSFAASQQTVHPTQPPQGHFPQEHRNPADDQDAKLSQKVQSHVSRRHAAALLASSVMVAATMAQPANAMLGCPGLNGRPLQQCLKKARIAKELEEDRLEAEAPTEGDKRKYESIGELVTLPSGVQYREMETGTGAEATVGTLCEISYAVYRLASGAYFKYSSGGTPVYMWDYGFGIQDKSDLGSTYNFRLGNKGSLPAAAAVGVKGMRVGGRRRILIPPRGGWVDKSIQPRPPNFGGSRRLAAHYDEPLLFEVQLVRVREGPGADDQPQPASLSAGEKPQAAPLQPNGQQAAPYKLPTPPTPSDIQRRPAAGATS
mmetsp:Transcript_7776/g.22989  ORF Transcript_7776/g.22989 Transcript_7776/m.22989 type:complete len:356 (+) Transcript_7776:882-1949(+)